MNPLRQQTNPLRQPIPNAAPQQQGQVGATNTGGPMNLMQRMIFNKLYNTNPKFRDLADRVRDKTPEQAFQEQGLDYNQFQNIDPTQIKNMLGF